MCHINSWNYGVSFNAVNAIYERNQLNLYVGDVTPFYKS